MVRDATARTLYSNPRSPMVTAKELVAALDTNGMDVAVLVGIGWTDLQLAREANDYALEAADRFPGRIVAFCSVNPAWGETALREVERCAAAGARGVGELHPDTQGFRLDDIQLLEPLARLVHRLGLVLLTHTSEPVGHQYAGKGHSTPDQVLALIEALPDLPVICAHWGGGLPFYALMPEVGAALKNVYFDSAASSFLYGRNVFSVVAKLVGEEKVLFGTDYPLLSHRRILADLEASGLSPEARRKVLGDNAARLLGLRPHDE